MRYRAVFFDLGGTLFSYRAVAEHLDLLLARLVRGRGLSVATSGLRGLYERTLSRIMDAYTSRPFYFHREMFAAAAAAFLRELGAEARLEDPDVQSAGLDVLAGPRIVPRPEARDALARLRRLGLHVAVVSNIDDDQFEAIWSGLELDDLVDTVTTSEQARSCKPDPGIFRQALAKAGELEPASVLFVGDSVDHDVRGANALGMTSVLIGEPRGTSDPLRTPAYVIQRLDELVPIASGDALPARGRPRAALDPRRGQ